MEAVVVGDAMKSIWNAARAGRWVLWAACLLSGGAQAHGQAVVSAWADVHAGPAPDYPEVAVFEPGSQVVVYGCLADYSWCDVSLAGYRGWVYAGYLNFPYAGSDWPVVNYGSVTGFPIISFTIGPYWDHYYRGTPWYHDRDRWIGQPVMPRPPEPFPPDRRPPERHPPEMRLNLPRAAPMTVQPQEAPHSPSAPAPRPPAATRDAPPARLAPPERVDRPRDERRPERRDDDRRRRDNDNN